MRYGWNHGSSWAYIYSRSSKERNECDSKNGNTDSAQGQIASLEWCNRSIDRRKWFQINKTRKIKFQKQIGWTPYNKPPARSAYPPSHNTLAISQPFNFSVEPRKIPQTCPNNLHVRILRQIIYFH